MMNLLFMIDDVSFNLMIAGIFIYERLGSRQWVRKLGVLVVLLVIPFSFVFMGLFSRPANIFIKLGLLLVLVYLLVELLLDFVIHFDFRARWVTHIPYILLEYSAFFGLIYVASTINKTVLWLVSITFWIAMACLIFLYTGSREKRTKVN